MVRPACVEPRRAADNGHHPPPASPPPSPSFHHGTTLDLCAWAPQVPNDLMSIEVGRKAAAYVLLSRGSEEAISAAARAASIAFSEGKTELEAIQAGQQAAEAK